MSPATSHPFVTLGNVMGLLMLGGGVGGGEVEEGM